MCHLGFGVTAPDKQGLAWLWSRVVQIQSRSLNLYGMLSRDSSAALHRLAHSLPIVVVTGTRQSGKIRLVRQAFHELQYVTLEDLDRYDRGLSDPRRLLDLHADAVLDEVQRAPGLMSYLLGIDGYDPLSTSTTCCGDCPPSSTAAWRSRRRAWAPICARR